MKKHMSIQVYGVVQGVFFRHCAKEKADLLGITGYISNRSDGSVLAEAEGEENELQHFLSWCRKGPDLAQVERLEHKEGKVLHYQGFAIK